MIDLLSSLIIPSPRSSQDSFRSLNSQPRTSSPSPSVANPQSAFPTSSSAFQASVFQASGLPISDVNTYLTENAHLRSKPTGKAKRVQNASDSSTTNPVEPVSLGTKTSFHVAALNTQCQLKGFLPIFELNGLSDFGGVLKLRDVTVTSDQRWRSKKEAREGLAEKGMEVVKDMEASKKDAQSSREATTNWIGLLHEYHNLSNPNLGPVYHDYGLGTGYACTCTIPALPDRQFGSTADAFTSKKSARANAAREAVEYLVEKGELNKDGTTKGRKKVKVGTAVRVKGKGLEIKKNSTYTQKVTDLCPLLGLTCPQYHLGPESTLAPNMLSGYATFQNVHDSDMPAEIGEVRNVFGKKKAKEEIARGVWQVLEEIAAKRKVKIHEEDGDDSGSGSGSKSEYASD